VTSLQRRVLIGLALSALWPAFAQEPASVPPPSSGAPAAKPALGPQRMDLDASAIRGNQELPKVLYIVPWKEPGLAEPAGRPLNSLVDEVLAPVDREVFRRQMTYFHQLYAPSGGSSGPQGAAP
jgi:hypothetical protein